MTNGANVRIAKAVSVFPAFGGDGADFTLFAILFDDVKRNVSIGRQYLANAG